MLEAYQKAVSALTFSHRPFIFIHLEKRDETMRKASVPSLSVFGDAASKENDRHRQKYTCGIARQIITAVSGDIILKLLVMDNTHSS